MDKIDLNIRNSDGKTALHLASASGDSSLISLLCYYDCCIEITDSISSRTPLKTVLLKSGADYSTQKKQIQSYISDDELNNLLDNHDITNLIFEGGGIKGIAYVGAIKQALRENVFDFGNIINIGGTSAGAITAVLLALDYQIPDIEKILGELDLMTFLDSEFKETFIKLKNQLQNNQANFSFLLSRVWDLLYLRDELNKNNGLFPGNIFLKWIDEIINKKLKCENVKMLLLKIYKIKLKKKSHVNLSTCS